MSAPPVSPAVWPRYVVGSLTGYRYLVNGMRHIGGARGNASGPSTTWYLYDRAFGRRIVGTFDGQHAEQHARHAARRQNGEFARWLRLNGHR